MAEPQGIGQTAEEKAAAEAYVAKMAELAAVEHFSTPPTTAPEAESFPAPDPQPAPVAPAVSVPD